MTVEEDAQEAATMLRAGRIGDAEAVYRRILARQPDNKDAIEKLGFIARAAGRGEEAVALMTRLAEMSPGEATVQVNLGNTLLELGRGDAGLEHLRRALELNSDNAQANFSYGSALLKTGATEDAARFLETTLRLTGGHAEALRLLSMIRTIGADHPIIAAMERMLTRPNLDDGSRLHLHYGLGNALEKAGDYDRAFARFSMANQIMHRACQIPLDLYRDYFHDLRATFDRARLSAPAARTRTDVTPILIVGLPRCGSTVLETMLSRHSEVATGGELSYLTEEVSRKLSELTKLRFPGCIEGAASKTLSRLGNAYLDRLGKLAPGKPFVSDKNLAHFQLVGLVRMVVPHARVIHVTRDPMDLGLSIYRNFFAENLPFYSDLDDLGRYYRLYRELMAHWRDIVPGFVHEVAYERLVTEPEAEMRAVLEFCGLEWEPACLQPELSDRAIRTISAVQARRPLYKSSIGGWKLYAAHLEPLRQALGQDDG